MCERVGEAVATQLTRLQTGRGSHEARCRTTGRVVVGRSAGPPVSGWLRKRERHGCTGMEEGVSVLCDASCLVLSRSYVVRCRTTDSSCMHRCSPSSMYARVLTCVPTT